MKIETIVLSEERNVTLTAFIQDIGGEYRNVTKRPAIIVIPGGGYMFCSDREAEPVAFEYLKAGYDAFILRYSVKKDSVWPQPLLDYEEAMEYIKAHAEEWNILADKIAVVGFSAGGHLAASAATLAKNKPAAAILGYPVVNTDVVGCNPTAPELVSKVDKDTSPCFIFGSRTDNVVLIQNILPFIAALAENGISFENHFYAYGPHGFSTADPSIQASDTHMASRVRNWVPDSISWLRDMLGDFGEGCMKRPACKPRITDDGEAWLSLDCTIARIFGNPEAKIVLKDALAELEEKIVPFEPGMSFNLMMQILGKMTMRNILVEYHIAMDQFDELDEKLGKIPNI